MLAPAIAQRRFPAAGLDPLGDHDHAQRAAEAGDRADHLLVVDRFHRQHDPVVDLEVVELQLLEVAQARIIHLEIVERDPHAGLLQRREDVARERDIVRHRMLGDIDDQPLGGEVALGQDGEEARHQIFVIELARRQIDRQRHVRRPVARREARFAQDAIGHQVDDALVAGDGDEACGPEQPARRVVPARQRLEPRQLPVAQAEDGLEIGPDLAGGERAAQVRRDRRARVEMLVHAARPHCLLAFRVKRRA